MSDRSHVVKLSGQVLKTVWDSSAVALVPDKLVYHTRVILRKQ